MPAYIRVGNEIEKQYTQYTQNLKKLFDELHINVKKYAPELNEKLRQVPPSPVQLGYQVLPNIIKEYELAIVEQRKPVSVSYSWKQTRIYINSEIAKIEDRFKRMQTLVSIGPEERKKLLSRELDEYKTLESNQLLIDHHYQYNRFWQDAVSKDRTRFDHLTKLHDAVVELEDIRDRTSKNEKSKVLASREQELQTFIENEIHGQLDVPPFAKLERPSKKSNFWTLIIPVATDINDTKFLDQFKASVERIWSFSENVTGTTKIKPPGFRVVLDIKKINLDHLKLKKYSPIDIEKHIMNFPKDRAVLTTGSKSTFAIMNRYIALGPQEITERVLAHEFGHILGFADTYFRGYRDRGEEGFEILEIVPDYTDIMGNPDSGIVKLTHFERLMEKFNKN